MTRQCEKCGFVNQDYYDFCAKCGNPLVEGAQPKQIYVYKPEQLQVNKKALIAAYIATIFLSWSGFVIFHAVLSSSITPSYFKKTWFDNDDDFICWCCTFFLCFASLDENESNVSH